MAGQRRAHVLDAEVALDRGQHQVPRLRRHAHHEALAASLALKVPNGGMRPEELNATNDD